MNDILEKINPENISGSSGLDFSHPFKKLVLIYLVGSIVLSIPIFILTINTDIFGSFEGLLFAATLFIILFHSLSLVGLFIKPRYTYYTVMPHDNFHNLKRKFHQKFIKIKSILPQVQLKSKKKPILIALYCANLIIVLITAFFIYYIGGVFQENIIIIYVFAISFIILFLWTGLFLISLLDNYQKKKIAKAKILQSHFKEYYSKIGLEFEIQAGEFKNPGFGIILISEVRTKKQTEILSLIRISRELLYYIEMNRLFIGYSLLPLFMLFFTPFSFDLSNFGNLFYMVLFEFLFFVWIIYVFNKVNKGEKLKKQICIVLGIYIPRFRELQQDALRAMSA